MTTATRTSPFVSTAATTNSLRIALLAAAVAATALLAFGTRHPQPVAPGGVRRSPVPAAAPAGPPSSEQFLTQRAPDTVQPPSSVG